MLPVWGSRTMRSSMFRSLTMRTASAARAWDEMVMGLAVMS